MAVLRQRDRSKLARADRAASVSGSLSYSLQISGVCLMKDKEKCGTVVRELKGEEGGGRREGLADKGSCP